MSSATHNCCPSFSDPSSRSSVATLDANPQRYGGSNRLETAIVLLQLTQTHTPRPPSYRLPIFLLHAETITILRCLPTLHFPLFFSALLPISGAFFTQLLVAGKNDSKNVRGQACARLCVCTCTWATKPSAKLRVVLSPPPLEARLRLSSLFSRSGFQLCEERDGELLCLCCGSSNPAVHWEPAENNVKETDLTVTHRQHSSIFAKRLVDSEGLSFLTIG